MFQKSAGIQYPETEMKASISKRKKRRSSLLTADPLSRTTRQERNYQTWFHSFPSPMCHSFRQQTQEPIPNFLETQFLVLNSVSPYNSRFLNKSRGISWISFILESKWCVSWESFSTPLDWTLRIKYNQYRYSYMLYAPIICTNTNFTAHKLSLLKAKIFRTQT